MVHSSKTSGLRSACKHGLQLAHAVGKHVMDVTDFLSTDERSNAPSLQPEGKTAGFSSGFAVKSMGRIFWEKQRGITGRL